MVSTPVYNLTATTPFQNSILSLAALCRAYDVKFAFNNLHDSLISRARNRCADIFLSQEYDYHVWIDSDIQFEPMDLLNLLTLDYEFLCAPYPKKQINWKRIRDAVAKCPEIDPDKLQYLGSDFVMNIVAKSEGERTQINLGELLEITDAGTGFMILKRSVYEKLIASGKINAYEPMGDEPSFFGPKIYDFFRVDIDPNTQNYLSEDYWFSRQWKAIGGKVWMAPWVNLSHWGTYCFRGSLMEIAEIGLVA
jgi:hypothetical protein